MKIEVQRQELNEAIGIVKPALGGMAPVFNMIRLTDGKIEATNGDTWITTTIDAKIEEPGVVLIPGNRLAAITKEIKADDITIESDERAVTIRGGKSYFKLQTMPADEFPNQPEQKESKEITINPDDLARVIREVSTAISTDESRFTLNGINLDIKNSEVVGVTSDGRRLAITQADIINQDEIEQSIIIPASIIPAIKGIIGSGGIALRIEPGKVEISNGVTSIISRLVEGRFPDYNQVIPSSVDKTITINRQALINGMKMASIMTDDKSNSVKLAFGENLIVTAIDPEGESREEIDLIKSDGELEIAFNPWYIIDALKSVDDKEVQIDLIDSDSPGVIKAGKLSYIIMPMKL